MLKRLITLNRYFKWDICITKRSSVQYWNWNSTSWNYFLINLYLSPILKIRHRILYNVIYTLKYLFIISIGSFTCIITWLFNYMYMYFLSYLPSSGNCITGQAYSVNSKLNFPYSVPKDIEFGYIDERGNNCHRIFQFSPKIANAFVVSHSNILHNIGRRLVGVCWFEKWEIYP